MDLRMAELRKAQDEKLETVRSTMETRISAMQGAVSYTHLYVTQKVLSVHDRLSIQRIHS